MMPCSSDGNGSTMDAFNQILFFFVCSLKQPTDQWVAVMGCNEAIVSNGYMGSFVALSRAFLCYEMLCIVQNLTTFN